MDVKQQHNNISSDNVYFLLYCYVNERQAWDAVSFDTNGGWEICVGCYGLLFMFQRLNG